jgi:hypothetical protein
MLLILLRDGGPVNSLPRKEKGKGLSGDDFEDEDAIVTVCSKRISAIRG